MNELKTLEDRLKSATDRISAALGARDSQSGALVTEKEINAKLQTQLSQLRTQRESDLAEVNKLIDQLNPLMEGNGNA